MLPTIINIFHTFLVFFTIFAPFTDRPGILLLHISYSVSLLTHWYLNNNSCCLTLFESTIRGVKTSNTFMHKLVSPMYNISESKLSKLVWIFTILLMSLSIYKFYTYITTLKTVSLEALFDTQKVKI